MSKAPIPDYQKSNRALAEYILADAMRHGGEGALLVIWAQKVMEKARGGKDGAR